jgi:hypothetical protein
VTNNINVSLDSSNGVNRLSVTDNGGQNQVGTSPNPTTISWNLTGQLTQGSFVAMDAALPGFQWVQPPPANLFGTPTISANGNSLSITDNHVDSSSNGQWIYMLRVNYNGAVISTQATVGVGGTVNNPLIINKGP